MVACMHFNLLEQEQVLIFWVASFYYKIAHHPATDHCTFFTFFFFLFFSPVAFPQVCHWSGKHFWALYMFQVVMFWDNSFHGYKVCPVHKLNLIFLSLLVNGSWLKTLGWPTHHVVRMCLRKRKWRLKWKMYMHGSSEWDTLFVVLLHACSGHTAWILCLHVRRLSQPVPCLISVCDSRNLGCTFRLLCLALALFLAWLFNGLVLGYVCLKDLINGLPASIRHLSQQNLIFLKCDWA